MKNLCFILATVSLIVINLNSFAQEKPEICEHCPQETLPNEKWVVPGSTVNWEKIELPDLLIPGLSSLKEICESTKQNTDKNFAIYSFKSHACDGAENKCIHATQFLSEPENKWLFENFSLYHLRISQKGRGFTEELLGLSLTGIVDYISRLEENEREGILLIIDIKECKILGHISDGRFLKGAKYKDKTNLLNAGIFDIVSKATKDNILIKPEEFTKEIATFSEAATLKAVEHQTEISFFKKLPPMHPGQSLEERKTQVQEFLKSSAPLNKTSLRSLKMRFSKDGLLDEGAKQAFDTYKL